MTNKAKINIIFWNSMKLLNGTKKWTGLINKRHRYLNVKSVATSTRAAITELGNTTPLRLSISRKVCRIYNWDFACVLGTYACIYGIFPGKIWDSRVSRLADIGRFDSFDTLSVGFRKVTVLSLCWSLKVSVLVLALTILFPFPSLLECYFL